MEIKVSENVINTVCNSLRASKHDLKTQLKIATKEKNSNKEKILEYQLNEVEEALSIFGPIN